MPIVPAGLPPEQQALRDRCFHPSGTFVEFQAEEIEQSISDRFEDQVRRHAARLAIETASQIAITAVKRDRGMSCHWMMDVFENQFR